MFKVPSGNRLQLAASHISERVLQPHKLITAGKTPFDIVYDNGLVRLRHYRNANPKVKIPLVIVPPLAVNMLIYDWFPDRSFVKSLLQQGFDVYLIDWGKPNRRHAHYTLKTYVSELLPEFLNKVREHSGSNELSLHGWSMGGGFALCYAALTQDPNVRNIITLGTAVDGHANGQIGKQYAAVNQVLKRVGVNLRKVPARWAYTPAWINAIAFKLSDPISSAQGYIDLIKNLDDREFVAQNANQSAFMDNLEAYPGGVIRDWMYSIWLENEASRGEISLGREKVYFKNIQANLLCCAGTSDKLANEHCCKPLVDMVGSKDKTFKLFPGGHTGIVSGTLAPTQIWPDMISWLAQRSA